MLYLVAQGPEPQQRWRRRLVENVIVTIGRSVSQGVVGWQVEWDSLISRVHAELKLESKNCLRVQRVPGSTNPVFFNGQKLDQFVLAAGDHFVIGRTRFQLIAEQVHVTMDLPLPDAERNFAPEKIRRDHFRDAGQKIAVLSQLPEVIAKASNDDDLHVQIVNILLTGIRRSTTVGIVKSLDSQQGRSERLAEVIHWDQRLVTGRDFQPSGNLIRRAVNSGETVLHVWESASQSGLDSVARDLFTVASDGDWAFVTPLTGDASRGLAIYIAGSHETLAHLPHGTENDALDLHDDIKFTELVATTLANLNQVNRLKQRQASLRPFFSPVVLDAISQADPDKVLAPRECEVSVLFCDLRGFSMRSEQYADELLELLDRVSQALGVTTREILAQRGVVGDFHGDAAMGFWGWPLEQPDGAVRACQAALNIQAEFSSFARQKDHPLHDFQIGLGIATGNAVAGRIGTEDQVKVTVFGPVANVASRLESMTQRFRAGILIDERTDQLIRQQTAGESNSVPRVRRLIVVQPYGMKNAIEVSQILPAIDPDGSCIGPSDEHIRLYESGLDEFTAGRWQQAYEILHQIPAIDQAKDFLTVYIAQHNRVAPADWPGFISLKQK